MKKNFSFYYSLIKKIKRLISYYKLRLARLPASTYAISSGFACGSMVSFTPLLGLHFLLAIFFAYLMRGNIVAALLGTFVGNPITFPFIWGLIYNLGANITSETKTTVNPELSFDLIFDQTLEIFTPMLIGGLILALPIWLITYLITYSFVSSYKKSKQIKEFKKNKGHKIG